MDTNKLVKNDMWCTAIEAVYNIYVLEGNVVERMPDFKKVIEQGYKMANYRDYALRQMGKCNIDKNDRNILNEYGFAFAGNPVIGDPNGSKEQIIINDLEQKVFEPLKLQILNMDMQTHMTLTYSLPLAKSIDESKVIYDQIKKDGAPFITVITPEEAKGMYYYVYELPKVRERILEGYFLGKLDEKNEFEKHVFSLKKDSSNREPTLENTFGYKVGDFTHIRLLVGMWKYLGGGVITHEHGRLLAVRDENYSRSTKEERKVKL